MQVITNTETEKGIQNHFRIAWRKANDKGMPYCDCCQTDLSEMPDIDHPDYYIIDFPEEDTLICKNCLLQIRETVNRLESR